MTDLVVHPAARPLRGSVGVPSDKSIGHGALLFSAMCTGSSRIKGFSGSEDNLATMACLRALGVSIDVEESGGGASDLLVHGVGLRGFTSPAEDLDCRNSGTTMRLLLGVLAAQSFRSVLVGDALLSKRPMRGIAEPLWRRGARVEGRPHPTREGDITAPLSIGPLPEGKCLGPLSYESPVSSAQVKSAVLLSGLFANGPTYFKEPTVSRDHTERLLAALGVPIETLGPVVRLDPAGWNGVMPPLDMAIPGDLSAAAFLIVAAQLVPESRVTVRVVGVNPSRAGVLEIARDMGAGLIVEPGGDRGGEPIANLHAWPGRLRSAKIGGEVVARAIDEVPIVCALAVRAKGVSLITDAEELRVKESDRIKALARTLQAFGVRCEERPDGLMIEGKEGPLEAADVHSSGDHRIAMTAAILALSGRAPSVVRDVDCIQSSFPKFVATLRALGGTLEVRG
jgi:3-phosphoshikimate 1-carboxyvinyltransferase